MNNIQIFENKEFGKVRTIEENGKYLFCAKDVATALGYKDTINAIKTHCKGVVKRHLLSEGGSQLTNFIPEGDVYRLITHSKLPSAERFEKWVFDEVLPSIRKHGAYMTSETLEAAILNPDVMISICSELKKEQEQRKKLQAKVELDAPKVKFAESIVANGSTITIQDFAKILSQNGCCIGRNKLYDYLIQNEYLCKRSDGGGKIPTQKAVKLKIFEVTEKPWGNSYRCGISVTSRLTPKGQKYFLDRKDEIKQFVNESKQAADQKVLDIAEYM